MRKLTKVHREAISKACKGRKAWNKGVQSSKESIYKNMASHIRFNISWKWLSKFRDIEKLKILNDVITNRDNRYDISTKWYKSYIKYFYNDNQFNQIYTKWITNDKEYYFKPSIDHIIPISKGGTNNLENLQFLTWFENRCKNNMTHKVWNVMKNKIGEYFA